MFPKFLIANRGEIDCRVIRTRRRGIRTVAVYSGGDANAQRIRLTDGAHPIGGPTPAGSYLRLGAAIASTTRGWPMACSACVSTIGDTASAPCTTRMDRRA